MEHSVVEQFIADAKADLGEFVRESGSVLYSSPKTLKPGDVYLLGINPGADPDGLDDPNIEDHLDKLPSTDMNSYLDGEWDRGRIGQDPFQVRVVWLLQSLGYDPREVCASNLIFSRSHGQGGSGYPATADRCWPVHQRIFRIVQPKLVICLGNLPFDYITGRSGYNGLHEEVPSGHGDWQCRAQRVNIEGRLTDVVSVPHLSRYNVIGNPAVAKWIKTKLQVPPVASRNAEPVPPQTRSTTVQPPKSLAAAQIVSRPVAPTPKAEQGYQIPWDGISGHIVLTGAYFSARGARGRAWETLRTRNWIPVRDWILTAKKTGNEGCGRGDLDILCSDKWRAVVIVDAAGKQLHPPTTGPVYHKRPGC